MDDHAKPPRPRLRWWIASLVTCGVLTIAAAVWYFRGHTVWTDGQGARVASVDAPLRQVVWTAPEPLEPPIPATADEQQYEPALSPDGTEFYFVRGKPGGGHAHIYASYRRDNQWTTPVPLDGVNGPTDDLSPRVTADGRYLLFSSDRPGGVGGFDLWAAPRLAGGKWGAPYNLGPAINSEFNESNPDLTPDGKRLIFSTDRKAAGKEQIQAWSATIRQTVSTDYDLWIARLDDDDDATSATTAPSTRPSRAILFKDAREIPGGVNTNSVEGASCVSPVGDFLYFASNRPGGYGKFDLYRSRIIGDQFGPPENLGPTVNSPSNEADPALTFGGFRLCFSSDRYSPRGVYALFRSDSREVFATREGRAFPQFGWSIWSLIISALLLIPLIMALRGADMRRRLNTLQKCLILSLLVHATLTFIFSFILVTQDVVQHVKRGLNGEVGVNLNLPKDVEIGLAVRSQLSSDLPSADAPPTSVARAVLPPDERSAPSPTGVKTDAPAHAAVVSLSVAAPASPPIFSPAAPPVTATLDQNIPATDPSLGAIALKLLGEKVADTKADVTPTFEKPTTTLPRTATTLLQPAAPAPAVTASIPKASAPTPTPRDTIQPVRSDAVAPTYAATSDRPSPSVPGAMEKLSDLNPVTPVASQRLTQPAPAAAASLAAPSPTSSPLTTRPTDTTNATAPAIVVASGSTPARPTTAPVALADESLKPSPYRPADLSGVTTDAVVRANPPAPIGPAAPILPPIAAAVARVRPEPDKPASAIAGDALPAAARLGAPSAAAPPPTPIDITAALAPVSLSTAPAASIAPNLNSTAAPNPISSPTVPVQPELVAAAVIPAPINLGPVPTSPAPFPRAPEVRRPRVEKLGGNKESEEAVDRGLAYLARNQQRDGRWTFISSEYADNGSGAGRRPQSYHDMGNTGLALLALLARDNTPDKPGLYRNHVNKALNFLIDAQEQNGDLRGPSHLQGADSTRADMYDHAIATLALAEAAIMTGGDKRYTDAALRGARFIVAAQDPESGGWRYVPGQFGDTSVFGWQIMALHACEKLGFEIPQRTRDLADDWIRLATLGPRKMLAVYQPRRAPTPAMTAEMLYTRMLLGQKLEDADIREATDFLTQTRPDVRQPNVYYWYYGSLCMLQVQNDLWKRWNAQTRDALIAMQSKNGGGTDGSWNADPKYGDRGGRIYMTSLALLTLEVYYRYERVTPP